MNLWRTAGIAAIFGWAAGTYAVEAELNAFGDDKIEVYVNGLLVEDEPDLITQKMVTLNEGANVIAAKLTNIQWGGGALFSLKTADGKVFPSDMTWRVNYKAMLGEDWKTAGFDDSKWGYCEDLGNAESWPGFVNSGTRLKDLYEHNARLIYGQSKNYFRVEFDSPSDQTAEFRMRGVGFTATAYVNGTQVFTTGDKFYICGTACLEATAEKGSVQLTTGKNVLALEAEDMLKDGNGAFFKAGVFGSTPLYLTGISQLGTMKVNVIANEGWKTTGFDDSDWAITGYPNDAHDPLYGLEDGLTGAKWTWPQVFYYRKEFTVANGEITTGTIAPARSSQAAASKPVETRWFTLTGARVDMNSAGRGAVGSVLLKRTVTRDGKSEISRSMVR